MTHRDRGASTRPPPGAPPRRRVAAWVGAVATLVVLAVVAPLVLVPQLASAEDALRSLGSVSLPLVLLATGLELASLAAYGALTAVVLGPGRPSYGVLLRIDLADFGLNHAVPGGGTTSGAARVRMLARVGVPLDRGVAAAGVEILGSNLVLGVVFALGLLLSLGSFVPSPPYRTAIAAVLVLLAACVLAGWALLGRTDRAVAVVRALLRPLPRVRDGAVEALVRTTAASVRSFGSAPGRLGLAAALAAGNWLLDAAALEVVLLAFDTPVSIGPLLAVYGLGSILMMVPLTPGGIGLVELVMVPAFVGFGVPQGGALLGVLGWRLLQFWLPLPIAVIAYASLRLGPFRRAAAGAPYGRRA
jgi:uncharacterized protein (TIRG00374 family)